MKEEPMTTVIVHGPGIDGPYRVVAQQEGGRLVLDPAPERSVADMLNEHNLQPISDDEFNELFGHLPTDAEG
jgi:hypothetical protein